jgi:hypothetical protein
MRCFRFKLLQGKYRIIEDAYAEYADKVQCFFFPLSAGNNSSMSHIEKKLELPIRSVALSPNDELVAFLHEYHREGRKSLRVALCHTQDIFGQPISR